MLFVVASSVEVSVVNKSRTSVAGHEGHCDLFEKKAFEKRPSGVVRGCRLWGSTSSWKLMSASLLLGCDC